MSLAYTVDDFIFSWDDTNDPLLCRQCLLEIAQLNIFLYQASFNICDFASGHPYPCSECVQYHFRCQTIPMVLRPEIWYLLYGNHVFSDQQIRERLSEILQPYRERHQQLGEDEA